MKMRNMKTLKWINTILILGLVVGMIALGEHFVQAQISGSAHDFSSETWSDNEICKPCHTPHNADMTVPDSPLWNHEVTTATFTPYAGSGTLDATDLGQPNGVSRLCLSCHDGTVALDSFGATPSSTEFLAPGDTAYLSSDLRNDHPISFTYDDALAGTDGELYLPSTATSGLGGTIAADMLFSGNLECASCHDVHNATGVPRLLLKSNAASALCLTCHNK